MLYEIFDGLKYGYGIVIETIAVAAFVFLFTLITGKMIIPVLRAKKLNQPINSYVAEHASKSGTPTMGGICFIISSLLVMLIWVLLESLGFIGMHRGATELIPLALTLVLGTANGMIGFIDDYKKLVRKQNEGLSEKQKLLLQSVVAAAYLFMMAMTDNLSTVLHIPFTDIYFDFGIFSYLIYFLAIIGMVNSTNITDGLDGLASSVGVSVAGGIICMSVFELYNYSELFFTAPRYTAVIAASLLGALLGFLVFNHYPAKVFMGDTGSLYIGGMIMGCAIMSGHFFAVVIMAFVYVLDMLSSFLQRYYYKLSGGKRIFKKAPIHHHFQLIGWSETKIVTVFFIVSALFSIVGVLAAVMI